MYKKLLLAILGVALATSLFAQPVGQNQLSGSECWNAGQGPGGTTTGFLCTNVVRGGTANTVLSAVSGNFTVGAASGNFTVAGSPTPAALYAGGNIILTAQPSAATITLPANPVPDGALVGVCNGTNAAFATNAIGFGANTGQTCAAPCSTTTATLGAGVCLQVQWNQSQATWYKVR